MAASPSGILTLFDQVREVTLAAVVTVEMHRHEHSGPTHLVRAFAAKTCDLIVGVDLVELEHCKLDLLALVLDLLWLRVCLLLALLAAARELRVHEERGLIGDS